MAEFFSPFRILHRSPGVLGILGVFGGRGEGGDSVPRWFFPKIGVKIIVHENLSWLIMRACNCSKSNSKKQREIFRLNTKKFPCLVQIPNYLVLGWKRLFRVLSTLKREELHQVFELRDNTLCKYPLEYSGTGCRTFFFWHSVTASGGPSMKTPGSR